MFGGWLRLRLWTRLRRMLRWWLGLVYGRRLRFRPSRLGFWLRLRLALRTRCALGMRLGGLRLLGRLRLGGGRLSFRTRSALGTQSAFGARLSWRLRCVSWLRFRPRFAFCTRFALTFSARLCGTLGFMRCRFVSCRLGLRSSFALRTRFSFSACLGSSLRFVSSWLGFRSSFAFRTRFSFSACLGSSLRFVSGRFVTGWLGFRPSFAFCTRFALGTCLGCCFALRFLWGCVRGCALGSRLLTRNRTRFLELPRLGSCRHCRMSVVHGSELAAIGARRILMLALRGHRWGMALMSKLFLRGRRTSRDTAMPAVIADVAAVLDNRLLINIVDNVDVHIIHPAVIEKVAAVPVTTGIAGADVTKSVVDSTVEADLRAPVAGIPKIGAVNPTPVTRRPEKTYFGRFHPRARNPEISTIIAVAPVAWRPDITIARTNGLRINR